MSGDEITTAAKLRDATLTTPIDTHEPRVRQLSRKSATLDRDASFP